MDFQVIYEARVLMFGHDMKTRESDERLAEIETLISFERF